MALRVTKTAFKVSDFLGWQRQRLLELSPSFQRRAVWKADAKSYFVDTIIRGYPVPIIFVREKLDLGRQDTVREIVDGQQRLRTLLGFIDSSCLPDFRPERDDFTVRRLHSDDKELHGRAFPDLPEWARRQILGYELSVHVLPPETEDREVLQIFARMNSTGLKLESQELRNAMWFGAFKTHMYRLALEQLDRWRKWGIFTEDQIARMREVEMTSDLILNMIFGLSGKLQKRLDAAYEALDNDVPNIEVHADRFRQIMDEIDSLFGEEIRNTVYSSDVHFFSLFLFLYSVRYALRLDSSKVSINTATTVDEKVMPPAPSVLRQTLRDVSSKFASGDVPTDVLDAVQRASTDYGRRLTRLQFMKRVLDGTSS